MFDDLLRANEATLFERFITRCVAPSLLLTALLHADFETRGRYLLVGWSDPDLVVPDPVGDPPLRPACPHALAR